MRACACVVCVRVSMRVRCLCTRALCACSCTRVQSWCACVRACACMYVCARVRVCARVCVSMCVCVCLCVCVCVFNFVLVFCERVHARACARARGADSMRACVMQTAACVQTNSVAHPGRRHSRCIAQHILSHSVCVCTAYCFFFSHLNLLQCAIPEWTQARRPPAPPPLCPLHTKARKIQSAFRYRTHL